MEVNMQFTVRSMTHMQTHERRDHTTPTSMDHREIIFNGYTSICNQLWSQSYVGKKNNNNNHHHPRDDY